MQSKRKLTGIFIAWFVTIMAVAVMAQTATLKDAFKDDFYIGTAFSRRQVYGKDSLATVLLIKHFNSITPENDLKWEKVHPELNKYDFEPVDRLLELAGKHGMFVVGHTLIWHSQTPAWVFEDAPGKPADRETLLKRIQDHIQTVVGRCKGRVHGWDVVNEAVEDNGELRQSKWLQIIGEDYIRKTFEWAREADPDAELYYNDYNMWKPGKVKGVVKLVKDLQAKGVKVDGIGLQGHWGLDYPDLKEMEEAIIAYAALGCKVMITELDMDILPRLDSDQGADISRNYAFQEKLNPYKDGLPDSMKTVQANRYADFFRIFHKHRDKISRVTLWGIYDGQSWRNFWPVRGRKAYPLLLDYDYQPKAAFDAVIRTAGE